MKLSEYIGETSSYDKKLMLERDNPVSWLKSVSAFANTMGGRLLFGVSDDGELVGLRRCKYITVIWRQVISVAQKAMGVKNESTELREGRALSRPKRS